MISCSLFMSLLTLAVSTLGQPVVMSFLIHPSLLYFEHLQFFFCHGQLLLLKSNISALSNCDANFSCHILPGIMFLFTNVKIFLFASTHF